MSEKAMFKGLFLRKNELEKAGNGDARGVEKYHSN
jgi:hypothetical protein